MNNLHRNTPISTITHHQASNLKPSEPFKGHFKRHRRPQGILPCKKNLVSFPALQQWNWVSLGRFATEGQLQNLLIQGFSGLWETRDSEFSQVPLNSWIMDEDLSPNRHRPWWATTLPSAKFKSVSQDCDSRFNYWFTNFIKYWYEMIPPANSIFHLPSYCSPSHVISQLTSHLSIWVYDLKLNTHMSHIYGWWIDLITPQCQGSVRKN